MPTIDQAYAHCRRLARKEARNFYYAFLLLARERRDAMCAVYSFMRQSDDIADDDDASASARREKLRDWRLKCGEALGGDTGGDPVLMAFSDAVGRYSIPCGYFDELLDGMESDLAPPVYRTFDDLYRYCYQAASVVGMTTIHVLGFDSDDAMPLAERCGIAFQLTNIMRDVSTDAALGRVYLPSSELEDFGLSRGDLLHCRVPCSDGRFQRLMDFQWQRAHRYFLDSAPLLPLVSAASRPALWALMSIYHGLLLQIRQTSYDVFRQRVSLPRWRKLWIVARAMQSRVDGGIPPFPA